MRSIFLLGIISLALLSCRKEEVLELSFEVTEIHKGMLYGVGDEGIPEQNILIENESDWNDLISDMNSVNEVSSSFYETDIDFTSYMVLAVFSPVYTSGGHGIEIVNVIENMYLGNIVATVEHQSPDSGGMVITVMTQPYHIVKISKRPVPVIFQ